jgi:hypothetical protein
MPARSDRHPAGVPTPEDGHVHHRTTLRIVVTTAVAVELAVVWHLLSDDPPPDPSECPPEDVDPAYGVGCHHTPPAGLDGAIARAAAEFDVDPWVLAVTVYRESGCDQYALGAAGEIGLAQVNPSVWMDVLRDEGIARRPQELYDVGVNLRAAAYVIRDARRAAAGDLFGTFRRYNGSGPKARRYAREQVYAYTTLTSPGADPR